MSQTDYDSEGGDFQEDVSTTSSQQSESSATTTDSESEEKMDPWMPLIEEAMQRRSPRKPEHSLHQFGVFWMPESANTDKKSSMAGDLRKAFGSDAYQHCPKVEVEAYGLWLERQIVEEIRMNQESKKRKYDPGKKTGLWDVFKSSSSVDLNVVRKLVEYGADVNCTDKSGETVLFVAVRSSLVEVTKYLIDHGADVNWKNIVKSLVEHGADVNWKDQNDHSLLYYAVQYRSLDIVKSLVEHGVDVNWKDQNDHSLLYYAVQHRSLDIVKSLVERGADVNWKDENDRSLLSYSVQYRSLAIIEYLVERGAAKDLTETAKFNCFHAIRKLKDDGKFFFSC
ncbi:uncharacterized protein LOC114519731 [Dendronephthya gigantea]|uniref:uncharacterized protein LOC114519731 n=1 Tax=Dendronephthya gigantea TaxID=151771 RepID=UPI001068DF85|nr:uncharacterized protein LOC114519731 [Dendronephthya gigantea]